MDHDEKLRELLKGLNDYEQSCLLFNLLGKYYNDEKFLNYLEEQILIKLAKKAGFPSEN